MKYKILLSDMPPAASKKAETVTTTAVKPAATSAVKGTSKKVNEPQQAAPVVPITQTAPVPAAPGKKTVAAKVTPVTPAPVSAEGAAATTDNVQTAGAAVGDNLISDLLEKFILLSTQIKTMQASLKLLAKEFDKQKKVIDKVQKKKEKAKKSPSGFAKPCKISDELCDFIGIPKGTEQSRTDITRFINSYVKQHNLNNPQNRREFFPDKKLKSILNVKDGEKVTYFVLQRLIAHHFPPSLSKLAAAAKAQ